MNADTRDASPHLAQGCRCLVHTDAARARKRFNAVQFDYIRVRMHPTLLRSSLTGRVHGHGAPAMRAYSSAVPVHVQLRTLSYSHDAMYCPGNGTVSAYGAASGVDSPSRRMVLQAARGQSGKHARNAETARDPARAGCNRPVSSPCQLPQPRCGRRGASQPGMTESSPRRVASDGRSMGTLTRSTTPAPLNPLGPTGTSELLLPARQRTSDLGLDLGGRCLKHTHAPMLVCLNTPPRRSIMSRSRGARCHHQAQRHSSAMALAPTAVALTSKMHQTAQGIIQRVSSTVTAGPRHAPSIPSAARSIDVIPSRPFPHTGPRMRTVLRCRRTSERAGTPLLPHRRSARLQAACCKSHDS